MSDEPMSDERLEGLESLLENNEWWRQECGVHMNVFEEALCEIRRLRGEIEATLNFVHQITLATLRPETKQRLEEIEARLRLAIGD